MVKTLDIRHSSKEPGGYLKEVKKNYMVQALRGMQPPCSWDDRTLSKKDRGVKIFSTVIQTIGYRLQTLD